MTRLVLASTSRYRRELLARLGHDFSVAAPASDESALAGESPARTALRLAEAKARAVTVDEPGALIIGSDQLAELDGQALGKPGSIAAARQQLAACSGHVVQFHTAVCVLDTRGAAPRARSAIDCTRVLFRPLDAEAIARYVEAERPLDCAGSFKAEGLGIALFDRIDSSDPTALVGLPLIALAGLLREAGVALP